MDERDGGIGTFDNATLEQYEGCLLGLALGDALGAPVEFLQLDQKTFRTEKDPQRVERLHVVQLRIVNPVLTQGRHPQIEHQVSERGAAKSTSGVVGRCR